jgi:hypothetical protein
VSQRALPLCQVKSVVYCAARKTVSLCPAGKFADGLLKLAHGLFKLAHGLLRAGKLVDLLRAAAFVLRLPRCCCWGRFKLINCLFLGGHRPGQRMHRYLGHDDGQTQMSETTVDCSWIVLLPTSPFILMFNKPLNVMFIAVVCRCSYMYITVVCVSFLLRLQIYSYYAFFVVVCRCTHICVLLPPVCPFALVCRFTRVHWILRCCRL